MENIDYFARAAAHRSASEAAVGALADLHATNDYDPRDVARYYDHIRQATKFAQVDALLAIAERLDDLVEALDDGRLSRDEVENLLASAENV